MLFTPSGLPEGALTRDLASLRALGADVLGIEVTVHPGSAVMRWNAGQYALSAQQVLDYWWGSLTGRLYDLLIEDVPFVESERSPAWLHAMWAHFIEPTLEPL